MLLVLLALTSHGQSVSDIRIAPEGNYLAFIRNADSLYLDQIPQVEGSGPTLIGTGLKDNFNQRFLKWCPDQQFLIWQSAGKLHQYARETGRTRSLDLSGLVLGKYFRIDQVGCTEDQKVYFSAARPNRPGRFSLYEADFKSLRYDEIVHVEGDIANVTISAQGDLLAFSEYRLENEKYSGRVHVFSIPNRIPLGSSTWYPDAFFHRLSFSSQRELLCRNAFGKAYVFALPELEDFLDEVASPEPGSVKFIKFIGDRLLCAEQTESLIRYSLRDREGNLLQDLGTVNEGEEWFFDAFPQVYTSFEDGVHPKAIYDRNNQLSYSFQGENPLSSVSFEVFTYTDQEGLSQNAYVYGSGGKGMLLIPYGGYANRYPRMTYFLNELAFSLLKEGYRLFFLNTGGYANQRLGRDYGKVQLVDTELFLQQWKKEKNESLPVYLMGHSHGATMVYYYLTHSSVFKAGIAINGASDWVEQAKLKRMTGLPGEMGGTPEELPVVYAAASPMSGCPKKHSPDFDCFRSSGFTDSC